MLSTLIIMAIAPIAGPLIGGQMIKVTSWHAIFWLLAIIGTLMLMSLFWLSETLPAEKRSQASVTRAFHNYYALLTNAKYMRFTLCLAFYYVAAYAFITGSPFVYITYFGVDPQYYGWLFAVNIVGLMAVSMLNRRLVHRYPLEALLKNAVFIATIAAIVLAIATGLSVGGITVIVGAVFVFFSMNGIIAATATACALDAVPNVAGSASALMVVLQYGIHALELIRSLLKCSRPSGLTQAICYGQRDEIRKFYREGQCALSIVTNAVVLWNTLYMQEALSWMRSHGEDTGDEYIARLSPQIHWHINMLGHYTFTLLEDILKGGIRTFNFNLNNELSP